MKAYSIFAKVYDEFMWDIPYDEWLDIVLDAADKLNIKGKKVLETGCGTGNFTFLMEESGYEPAGMDLSPDMIKQAVKKAKKYKYKAVFKTGDMRQPAGNDMYDMALCLCDGMNYLCSVADLEQTFKAVNEALKYGGCFIFDIKTQSFFEQLSDNVYTDEIERGSYVWENDYDEETKNNNYYLTFYLKKPFGLYKKYVEEHVQHAFSQEEIECCARKAGFTIEEIFEKDFTQDRVFYALRKEEK